MILGIDHGNSEIKTENYVFSSGFVLNPLMQQMSTDFLKYNNNSYALSNRHFPYRRDKTKDDQYYILTLFAIAKELALQKKTTAEVQLAVGLPPAHLQELKSDFYKYLVRDKREVQLIYNGIEYNIMECYHVSRVDRHPKSDRI